MGEEGEFKKRIQKLDDEKEFVAQDWLRATHIFPIINEAKNEFPVEFVKVEGETLIMGAKEMYEWFVKWFGSADTQTHTKSEEVKK